MLHGCTLQELSYLVMGLSALRSVGLRKVLEHGRRCGDVLACARKDRDRGVVRHYPTVDVSRPGTGPSSALTARELALERLELLLELPFRLGNFLLLGADLLRSGILPKLLRLAPGRSPRVGGSGWLVLITSRLGLAFRSVGHKALLRGVVAPGVRG